MNAAQLQNTTHLESIIVYTRPSGYNRQLALSLARLHYNSYVYMYELGSDSNYQTRYTTCGEEC